MSLVRINESVAAEGKADELYAFLQTLVPYISGSDGCLGCEVLRAVDELDRCLVIERWESAEHHARSIANFPREEMQAARSLFASASGRFYHAP